MEEKIKLIDKICELHPSLGVEKRWSTYTGGMMDSGHWFFRKMLDFPIEELQAFYLSQTTDKPKTEYEKDPRYAPMEGESAHDHDVRMWKLLVEKMNNDLYEKAFKDAPWFKK